MHGNRPTTVMLTPTLGWRAEMQACVGHAHWVVLLVLVQLLDLLLRIAQDVLVLHGPDAGLPEGSPTADLHADFIISAESRSGDGAQGLWLSPAGASAEAR